MSDDFFTNEFGTTSWILEDASDTQVIMGNVLISGFKADQSAYRSEIGGMYCLAMVIELIKDT